VKFRAYEIHKKKINKIKDEIEKKRMKKLNGMINNGSSMAVNV